MFSRGILGIGLAALLLSPGLAGAAAPGHDHDHDHGHAGHGATLQLNKGEKWKTDEALRAGMKGLRDALAEAIDPIHHGKYSAQQYKALGERMEKQLLSLIENCKLPPDADAQLHILLVDLFAGVKDLKGAEQGKQGAIKLLGALKTYADFFDHPDWKPIAH